MEQKQFQIRFRVDVRETFPNKTKEWSPDRFVRVEVWARDEDAALESIADKLKNSLLED